MEPATKAKVIGQFEEWERTLGVDLRHGVLKSFGDTWCVYGSPSEGNFFVTGITAVVPLRDWAGMNVAYGRLMGFAKQWRPSSEETVVPPGTRQTTEPNPIESYRFMDNDIYCFRSGVSLGLIGATPAWCMTKRELVLALSPQNVKACLSQDSRHESLDRRSEVARLFSQGQENGPSMIVYGDASHAFEMFYPLFSMYGGMFVASSLSDDPEDIQSSFLMPSCLSIHRHLGPTVATLRRTKDGVEFVSRGTIPLPSPVFVVGVQAYSPWFACLAADSFAAQAPPPQGGDTPASKTTPSISAPAVDAPSNGPAGKDTKTEKSSDKNDAKTPSKDNTTGKAVKERQYDVCGHFFWRC